MAGWARVIIVAALAGAIACTATAATGTRWKTYRRPAAGMQVSVPASWQAIPLTAAGVKQRIAQLRAQKRYELAAWYRKVSAGFKSAAFVAFAWPQPPEARTPTFVIIHVKLVQLSAIYLGRLVDATVDELRQGGWKLDPVRYVPLPAGVAGLLHGVVPSGGGTVAGTYYILLHAKHVFAIELLTDTRFEAQQQATFAGIAQRFRYL